MAQDSPNNKAWQRSLTTLSTLALFATVIVALYWARSIFIPVTMAVFIAFILSPLVLWLRRLGLGKAPTVFVAVALAGLSVVAVVGVVVWQMSELTMTVPEHTERITAKVASFKGYFKSDGENRFAKMMDDLSAVIDPPQNQDPNTQKVVVEQRGTSWGARASGHLSGLVSPATELLGQAAFALVLSVFILWKQDDLRNRLIRLIGDTRLTTATKAVDDASRRISRYLLMQLLINCGFGVLITITMAVIQVPYALLWGVLAALMRYIPYLGTWLGLIPPLLITVALTDGAWQPIVVIVVYGGLELLCGNVLEPRLFGSSLGVSEVAQLIAAAFWAFMWGPVGLILSGPLTVCLLVLGKYVSGLRFFEILLGDEPVLSLDVRFYQRLTARDQDEAWQLVREETKTKTRMDVFDGVVVPALTYAKRDWELHDLSDADLDHMLGMVREIVDDATEPEANDTPAAVEETPPRDKVRVLIVPAKDSSDELAGNMLRLLVDPHRWEAAVAPVAQLTSEVVQLAKEFKPAILVICTLPPGGLTHTRYVCKRIAKTFPEARIVVCRSGTEKDPPEATAQLTEAGAAHVATSLAETVRYLHSWLGALDSQQKVADKVEDGKSIGITPARSTVV